LLETLQEKGGHWQDTSKAILEALEPKKPSGSYAWPRSGRGVAGRLRELAPDLRQLGVEYNKETGGQRRYTFEYSKVPDVPQAPQATLDD
jgi:hypothetical protein